jgi:hypothetical protein
MFGGVRIIESVRMVDQVEDWSRVRSPSRAARRRRQGHRQTSSPGEVPSPVRPRVRDAALAPVLSMANS